MSKPNSAEVDQKIADVGDIHVLPVKHTTLNVLSHSVTNAAVVAVRNGELQTVADVANLRAESRWSSADPISDKPLSNDIATLTDGLFHYYPVYIAPVTGLDSPRLSAMIIEHKLTIAPLPEHIMFISGYPQYHGDSDYNLEKLQFMKSLESDTPPIKAGMGPNVYSIEEILTRVDKDIFGTYSQKITPKLAGAGYSDAQTNVRVSMNCEIGYTATLLARKGVRYMDVVSLTGISVAARTGENNPRYL